MDTRRRSETELVARIRAPYEQTKFAMWWQAGMRMHSVAGLFGLRAFGAGRFVSLALFTRPRPVALCRAKIKHTSSNETIEQVGM